MMPSDVGSPNAEKVNVMVVGSGGREHSIIWKLSQSPRIGRLICVPGNGGIAALAHCIPISATDCASITACAISEGVDIVLVASDDPLAAGLVDACNEAGIRAFGPTKAAARIESSKIFSKTLMRAYGVPTAEYQCFTEVTSALEYAETLEGTAVIKADGLALGKGVIIVNGKDEAKTAIRDMMEKGRFSEAGKSVVIEEFLEGREATVLCFTDGENYVTMPPCRDHKRAGDCDTGPNTGGMGAVCPIPDYTPEIHEIVKTDIIERTLQAMKNEGCPFSGVLYFELMLTKDGPKVIEYNARFGDPECQPLMLLLETDLLDIVEAVLDKRLNSIDVHFSDDAAAVVVLASGGYPGEIQRGYTITGLGEVDPSILIFHAGTARKGGELITSGGRVMGVTARRKTLKEALDAVYNEVCFIKFTDKQYRLDIGKRDIL